MSPETKIVCYCGQKISIKENTLIEVKKEGKVILTCSFCGKILSA